MTRTAPVPLVYFLLLAAVAHGQGTIEVTAEGLGEAEVTKIELRFLVSGEALLWTDAMKSFAASRRRAEKAIASLEVDGIEVGAERFEVSTFVPGQDPWSGGVVQPGVGVQKKKIKVQEVLVISVSLPGEDRVAFVDHLGTVIDTALDVGLVPSGNVHPNMMYYIAQNPALAPAPFLRAHVDDAIELRRVAYQQAMKRAQEKASQLAELSGGEIEGVKSIKVEHSQEVTLSKKQMTEASTTVNLRVVFTTKA